MIAHRADKYSQAFTAHESSKPPSMVQHEPIRRLAAKGLSSAQIQRFGYCPTLIAEALNACPPAAKRTEFVPRGQTNDPS